MPTIVTVRTESGAEILRLRDVALAAVVRLASVGHDGIPRVDDALLRQAARPGIALDHGLHDVLDTCIRTPAAGDKPLVRLAGELGLSHLEVAVTALAAAVEDDPLVGRVLAHVQAPLGGSRPTLGLVIRAFTSAVGQTGAVLPELLNGVAVKSGLLAVLNDTLPLSERSLIVPSPLWLALAGHDSDWPGATIGVDEDLRVALAPSTLQNARRQAAALAGSAERTMILRASSQTEARSIAAVVAQTLDRRAVFLEGDRLTGIGPWLVSRELLPVFCFDLAPGELRHLPRMAGYRGPVLALCGADGAIESSTGATTWTLPVPTRDERRILWWAALGDETLARDMGDQFRHGAGRIAHLGRVAHHQAALSARLQPNREDLFEAAWSAEGVGLDALAQPLRTPVPDEALVTPPALRRELDAVLVRCRLRDGLVTELGVSARTRYRPGVRALFAGPSGTGKTLAAGWIATRLGFPLYRVDLASVSSKYIGETEKNLSQLLARAEQAEVILLFDEADSLFGKRTDVKDSNDRFANAQTNYLLQRIETYDGIVLLTSNSQTRFDPAFARRLDFTIEFPPPGPDERRALWQSHLGPQARLTAGELNRLAVLLDVSGGHIRNAVLTAAARARQADRGIVFDDVLDGVAFELAKLGRQVPVDLLPPR